MLLFLLSSDWMMMITFFGSLGLLFALHIKRKESPTNLILLAAFVRKAPNQQETPFINLFTPISDCGAGLYNRSDFNILLKSCGIASVRTYVLGSCWTYYLHIPNQT